MSYGFCRGWYSSSNGAVVNAILRNLHIHFQGQSFSCYASAIKNYAVGVCPADLPPLARLPPWSRSGVALVINIVIIKLVIPIGERSISAARKQAQTVKTSKTHTGNPYIALPGWWTEVCAHATFATAAPRCFDKMSVILRLDIYISGLSNDW